MPGAESSPRAEPSSAVASVHVIAEHIPDAKYCGWPDLAYGGLIRGAREPSPTPTPVYAFDDRKALMSEHGTSGRKYAGRDILPLWVADMDFASPPCILQTLRQRVDQEVFG